MYLAVMSDEYVDAFTILFILPLTHCALEQLFICLNSRSCFVYDHGKGQCAGLRGEVVYELSAKHV